LKTSKGQSGTVIRRWTNNSMTKTKMTKGQTIIYKTLHRKRKIEQYNGGEFRCTEGSTLPATLVTSVALFLLQARRYYIILLSFGIFRRLPINREVKIKMSFPRSSKIVFLFWLLKFTFTQHSNIVRYRVRVFKATFNNVSVILWRSVLFVKENGLPWENHRPAASHWQTLSHKVVLSTPRHERDSNSQL
jgi:hypothetical protein